VTPTRAGIVDAGVIDEDVDAPKCLGLVDESWIPGSFNTSSGRRRRAADFSISLRGFAGGVELFGQLGEGTSAPDCARPMEMARPSPHPVR